MNDATAICAHDPCACQVLPAAAVSRDDLLFCSARCAEGDGCLHQDCDCSERTADADPSAAADARDPRPDMPPLPASVDHPATANLQRAMAAHRRTPGRPPTTLPLWSWITFVSALALLLLYIWGKAT